MGRMLTFLLGLAALGFASYWYITNGHVRSEPQDAPAATMQRMHEKAHDIEVQQQQYVDDALKRGAAAEQQ